MARGSKPGERRGGRKKGKRNRFTEAQLMRAEEETREIIASGRKRGKNVLMDFMEMFAGLAAYHQPIPSGMVPPPGREPHDEKFEKYARIAIDCARYVAPFQDPILKAIAVAPAPTIDPNSGVHRVTLTIFDAPRPALPKPGG